MVSTPVKNPNGDVWYTDGFPEGWKMVHRPDCTLLNNLGTTICASPKLKQGLDWLECAKQIANGFEGITQSWIDFREASSCDSCGYGPSVDEEGQELPNTRSVKTWKCDNCDEINVRPKK